MSYKLASDFPLTQHGLLEFALESTAAWHRAFGVPKHQASRALIAQRQSLQASELDETVRANLRGDAEQVIDGMMDELFVAAGTVDALHPYYIGAVQGPMKTPMELIEDFSAFPIEDLFSAFERVVVANFNKLWTAADVFSGREDGWTTTPAPGQDGMYVVRDHAGKIMKPPSFKPPQHDGQLYAPFIAWYSTESLI